jgi:FkbM family methyltransferase
VAVPYVNDSKLLVSPGMTGATGNVYTGLHEFEEMAFVLHTLRTNDLFIDVGANVGSYTVLASAVIGARSIAIEPIPAAYKVLLQNLGLNSCLDRVIPLNIAAAAENGKLHMTSHLDTTNRVVSDPVRGNVKEFVEVEARTIDQIAGDLQTEAVVLKIDVEGYEAQVLQGAKRLFASGKVIAVVCETQRLDLLHVHGYEPFQYHPFERNLEHLVNEKTSPNVIFAKDLSPLEERLRSAPRFRIHDFTL